MPFPTALRKFRHFSSDLAGPASRVRALHRRDRRGRQRL